MIANPGAIAGPRAGCYGRCSRDRLGWIEPDDAQPTGAYSDTCSGESRGTTDHATEIPTPTSTPIVAQTGEKLVLVAPFVGYTSDDLRFNVAGRIEEALAKEVKTSNLIDARIAVLPDPLTSQTQARAVLESERGHCRHLG